MLISSGCYFYEYVVSPGQKNFSEDLKLAGEVKNERGNQLLVLCKTDQEHETLYQEFKQRGLDVTLLKS